MLILCNKNSKFFCLPFIILFFMGVPFYVADKWEMYSFLVMGMW